MKKLEYLKTFESFSIETDNEETIEVTHPDDLSKTKAYKDLATAGEKLISLETTEPSPADAKTIANLVYNTASHEVHKLREKYKTDFPLSDFAKKSLNRQFEWDDEKVQMDPINITAQDYMRRAKKFIRIDDKQEIEKANMYFSRFTSDRNKDWIKGADVYVSEEGDFAAISFPGAHPKPRQYVFALFFSLEPAPCGSISPTSSLDSPHKTLPTCELFITKHEENYNKQVKAIVRKYNLESRLDKYDTGTKRNPEIRLTGLDLSIIENIVRDLNKL